MSQSSISFDYNNTFKMPNTKDVSCGSDISSINVNYFQGFHSIDNESQLFDLTGTTFKEFKLLLSIMLDSQQRK